MGATPRLRLFAGPNGSGKSTIQDVIPSHYKGVYINPDDIERDARTSGTIYLDDYLVQLTENDIREYFAASSLIQKAGLRYQIKQLKISDGCIEFPHQELINSYIASVTSSLIRDFLIDTQKTLTFETVMSSCDKINVLEKARTAGFRNYLYYIATDDPAINIQRVQNRVSAGGHDVPDEKVRQRYYRSLDLLSDAIRQSYRAFIFDNSGEESFLLAEMTPEGEIDIKTENPPYWFYHSVIKKFTSPD